MRDLALEGLDLEIATVISKLKGKWQVSGRVPKLRNLASKGLCLEIAIVTSNLEGKL